MTTAPRDTFFYDEQCTLTTRAVAWLKERSVAGVEFIATTPDAAPDHVSAALHTNGAVLITAAGARHDGQLAFGEVLRRSTKYDQRLAGRLLVEQPSKEIAGWAYTWYAKNRNRLSKRRR